MAGMLANFTMANSKGLYPKLNGSSGRRRKVKRKAAAPARRSARRKAGKPARLVKGSAAAKAYMAKIRRKRRR